MAALTWEIYSAGHVLAVGYALAAVLLLVLGILTLFVGLILHSIRAFFLDLKHSMQRDRVFSPR